MKFGPRHPFFILVLVLLWRVLLLAFTAQPIPANDAFAYDGAVVNFLHGGGYCNPSLALVFPISGKEVYSMYPPLYQGVLLVWMKLFGTSVISAMAMHLVLFAVSAWLTLAMVRKFFPATTGQGLAVLLLFGFTFDDRPESLAYIFGLAGLWLVARQISGPAGGAKTGAALVAVLLLDLYTSVIVGALFFGMGLLACVAALSRSARGTGARPRLQWLAPFAVAAILFALITAAVARMEPLWWAGFMESARQQSVVNSGWHLPSGGDFLKLVRTAPVFLVALAFLPLLWRHRRDVVADRAPWLALMAGIFLAGWMMLAAAVTVLAGNYVSYTILSQVILAAGLLALAEKYFPARQRLMRGALLACVLLVSVRAIGMSTWGVACAWKNSCGSSQAVVRSELRPFVASGQPVLVSSAFLYCAADLGVKDAMSCDWYFDHAQWGSQMESLIRLRPSRLVLTQFDYYRSFQAVLKELAQRPDLVEARVRDFARVRPPDAIPALQRVLQHISWAPVIVDLEWKTGSSAPTDLKPLMKVP